MKKAIKIIIVIVILGLLGGVLYYFNEKNSKAAVDFKTEKAFITSIEKKSVATGKVTPEDETNIKPQISGIIDHIYVEEGNFVKTGDLIAKIKIIPDEKALNSAQGRVKKAELNLENVSIDYNRNKKLLKKGVVSIQTYNTSELKYNQAKQEFENAKNDYQIIKVGSANSSSSANTNIRSTVTGTILEIPVKEGHQVIESNNFNAGTTIATIADLTKMIFEGKVDESEVGKLSEGTQLEVTIGAFENVKFKARLNFVAPKGTEDQGAVLFKIKANLTLNDSVYVRAGYSANAELILDKKTDILAIKESLVQYNRETDKPFVEVETGNQKFEKRDIKLGISDGIDVQVLSGVTKEDNIKVWNKASKENNKKNR
ncbi:efflux RND transporter periplasmic adaptor subunit [Flavicella marina]|uniref:efflux RND transporter periplasmic adaptor subunit n=1 Tax=Flavicella marina TaxID=1475951 RepID=UPI0012647D62|nr:efflux RND transporter periplasmic adaptor subunit [Flavicella marina]